MATHKINKIHKEGRRLFVSRLASHTRKGKLMDMFAPYGAEHVVILRKTTSNQAFITFRRKKGANQALDAGKIRIHYHNRKLKISPADSRHEAKLIPPSGTAQLSPDSILVNEIPLPIEIISKIAQYLSFVDRSKLEQVSRNWRLGSLTSYNSIHHLDLNDQRWLDGWEGKEVTTEAFYWVIKRVGTFLKSIVLGDNLLAQNLRPQVLAITIKNCPNLTHIDLTETTIRPSSLRYMLELGPRLYMLGVGKCEGPIDSELTEILKIATKLIIFKAKDISITGKSLIYINPNLQQLSFEMCNGLIPSFLYSAILKLQALTHLTISYCELIITHNILQALFNNSPIRNTLINISFHDGISFEWRSNDQLQLELRPTIELAIALPARYSNIVSLYLTLCRWITSETIEEIGQHMRQLETLNISGCINIRGTFGLNSLSRLTKLRIIEINYMHLKVGGYFLKSLRSLIEIHCRDSLGITDEDMCGAIRNCAHLLIIDIEGCNKIGRPTLECAISTVRNSHRLTPLAIYVGGSGIAHKTNYKGNLSLHVHRLRRHQPLFL
ncbi:uncharacterized protein LOC100879238 isoform X2 [Megachile rotundata]